MKKTFLFCAFLSLLFVSCDKDSDMNDDSVSVSKEIVLKSVFNSPIGELDSETGDFVLTATDESIKVAINSFIATDNAFISKNSTGKSEMSSYKIEKIDGDNYLRFYTSGDDDLVTTIAIEYNSKSASFDTGGTSCTSRDCNSGGGCVPNGLYCTKCQNGPFGGVGDCTRTTTGDTLVEP